MKKYYILLSGAMLAATLQTQAQTKIGGTGAPDGSAMLEVTGGTGNNKGILPPRLTTVQRDAITSPATGLMIYNTTANQLQVNTGTAAAPVWTGSGTGTTWNTAGNAGTTPATNFIGTTDVQPLVLRTNNAEKLRVTTAGNVGIGTTTPLYNVHVAGNNGTAITVENTDSTNFDYATFRAIIANNGNPIQTSVFAQVNSGNPNGGIGGIQTNTANPLVFATGQAGGSPIERMRIDNATGRVGIGTATPRSLLSITPNSDGAKITLWDGGNDTAHYGFGITGTFLNYHVINATAAHRFFAGGKNGNGTELMRIQGNGRVGVGTTTPLYNVHVAGNSGTAITVENTDSTNTDYATFRAIITNNGNPIQTSVFAQKLNGNPNGGIGGIQTNTANPLVFATGQIAGAAIERMRIDNTTGRVGIGTSAPAYALHVIGDINASANVRAGGVVLTSDARLKRNITNSSYGLSTIMNLRPVVYDKKNSIPETNYDRHEIGFIAQEIQKVLPSVVTEGKDADKTLAVSYTELIPVLTKAIQEQQAQIDNQNTQIETLQAENQKLKENKAVTAQLMERVKQMEQMMGINEIEGTSKVAGK